MLAVVLGFGIPLSVIDVKVHRLPNRIVAAMSVIAISAFLVSGWQWRTILGATAAFGFYALLAALPGQGMGIGDVKFAAVLGALMSYLSWDCWMLWAFVPFAAGALLSGALMITHKAHSHTRIPFGPCMVLGAVVAIVATW